jgi:hypothetical protein
VSPPPRWPLHPPPAPGEALTSWLDRLAAPYGMPVGHLLRHLGEDPALLDRPEADDLDFDPPPEILRALAARTGTDLGAVRMTTIAGWVPWLADTLEPHDGQEAFHNYVRRGPVLLAPGEAGRSSAPHWVPWIRVHEREWRTEERACQDCMAGGSPGASLIAALPLMATCGEHGCPLAPETAVRLAVMHRDPLPLAPVPGPVAAMDRLTWEGLTTGTVTLPRRQVHVGVWLRMLRTLLDEVSLPASRVRRRSAAALGKIWDAAGLPQQAGLKMWQPYEVLGGQRQEAILKAAAFALDLIQGGSVHTRGTLGRLLVPEPDLDVYAGDAPAPPCPPEPAREARAVLRRSWEQAREDAQAWFRAARADPAAARQILGALTRCARTRQEYDRERDFMISCGVPGSFLPQWPTGAGPALPAGR